MEDEINDDEYGCCPNCGSGVHISDMGMESGTACCRHCRQDIINEEYEEDREICSKVA